MLAVLVTAAAWYVGDWFYTGSESYLQNFKSVTISDAWYQVAWFLTCFSVLAPLIHRSFNAKFISQTSSVCRLASRGINDTLLQRRLSLIFRGCIFVWVLLVLIAIFRLGSEIRHFFFPFLSYKADPWARDRIGGQFDSLLSLASNLQVFVTASFGIAAALLKNPRLRLVAFMLCVLSFPYFIFDRTRNVMLSAMLPGILAWALIRFRGSWVSKAIILAAFFLIANFWFSFVIANRSSMSIAEALEKKGLDSAFDRNVRHEGLNMFEELCWVNSLTRDGIFRPSWGESYLSELVSPIPRGLWPDKPTIGLAYSVARGQLNADMGQGATISTGMIGQGVVSFGTILGPAFAAFLMGTWSALLARLDLQGRDFMLYGLGIILTFNLGRDITTITLYTFAFGSGLVWCLNCLSRSASQSRDALTPSSKPLRKPSASHRTVRAS